MRLPGSALASFLSDFHGFPNEPVSESGRWARFRGYSGVRLVPALQLSHGEIRGVRDRVASGSELQAVPAWGEA